MQKFTFTILSLFMILGQSLSAQGVEGSVLITNDSVAGSRYYFDVYLATRPTTTGDIYLADADFRISYDQSLFTNPTFQKQDSSVTFGGFFTFNIGYCTFVPSN
ncbi:MAG: hypothetical protein AAFQ68_18860, partial [Bacteroidota bacterium]